MVEWLGLHGSTAGGTKFYSWSGIKNLQTTPSGKKRKEKKKKMSKLKHKESRNEKYRKTKDI